MKEIYIITVSSSGTGRRHVCLCRYDILAGKITEYKSEHTEAEDGKKTTWNGTQGKWVTLKNGCRLFLPHGKKFEEAIKDLQNHERYVKFYGREFKGYKGYAAIDKLLKEKRGHVKAAFHHKDIGDIDLVWGTTGEGGGGLAHLIEHRKAQGVDTERYMAKVAETIEKGSVIPDPKHRKSRRIISYNGNWVVVETEYDEQPRNWIVTGFIKEKNLNGS